mmetsp:Transcript_4969/g.9333  ORF Transcript_4969/g.9333 Transcript_4969/m.9333 type:complete len:243 (-) Transcript_4969:276-1004(-)
MLEPRALPTGSSNPPNTVVHSKICKVPRTNAYFANAVRRSMLSSRPISNNRNSTPSSESSVRSAALPKAPICSSTVPAKRNPRMEEILNRLQMGTMATVAPRKTKKSRPSVTSSVPSAPERGTPSPRRPRPCSCCLCRSLGTYLQPGAPTWSGTLEPSPLVRNLATQASGRTTRRVSPRRQPLACILHERAERGRVASPTALIIPLARAQIALCDVSMNLGVAQYVPELQGFPQAVTNHVHI